MAVSDYACLGGVLTVIFTSMPVRAEDTWQLDPQHSVARLSLGSGSNAVGIGSARVSGDVVFESSDPADPFVRLKITPSNGQLQSVPR
jgi:hypothetical protein